MSAITKLSTTGSHNVISSFDEYFDTYFYLIVQTRTGQKGRNEEASKAEVEIVMFQRSFYEAHHEEINYEDSSW